MTKKSTKQVKSKKNWKKIGKITGIVLVFIMLPLAGVTSTLKYQEFINGIKAEGVAEYKLTCEKFTDKDKNVTWLECDE